jgi:hypothetical protein
LGKRWHWEQDQLHPKRMAFHWLTKRPNRSPAPQTEATYFPRRRCPGFFHVVFAIIRAIGFFRTARSLPHLRRDGSWSGVPLFGKNTEAAPNSATGSGRCLSPGNDGIVSFSSLSRGSRNVAPQKPRCPSWRCRRTPQRASTQPSRRVVRNAAACGECEGSSCHAWRRPLSSARCRGIRQPYRSPTRGNRGNSGARCKSYVPPRVRAARRVEDRRRILRSRPLASIRKISNTIENR